MLNKFFSERFIENARSYTHYKFTVMNPDGMIIAATETERVGNFHEASYRMMQEGRDIIFVTPEDVKKYFGVKPGIDVPIVYKNKMMGAIGITGIPHEVRPAIVIAKMAFETMLEYDDYQHNIIKKSSERELFRDYLLYSETKHTDELRALAQRLKYNINLFRVPILFELSNRIYSDDKLFLLELHNLCHENDMIFTTHEGDILIYKYVQINQDEIILRINHELENFIDTVSNVFDKREIFYKYYRGSLQNNFDNYSSGFKHCRWMQRNNYAGEDFFNYLEEYFTSLIPILEQNNIYSAIADLMDQQLREVLIDNFNTLKTSNFNLSIASQDLFIHKNTLIFRLNKIKNFFGIDPLHNNSDQFFLSLLHSFLKRSDKIKSEEV